MTTTRWTAKLKARNKAERQADADQLTLDFGPETLNVETSQFHKAAREADTGSVADLAPCVPAPTHGEGWKMTPTDGGQAGRRRLVRRVRPTQDRALATPPGKASPTPPCATLSENPGAVPDTIIKLVRTAGPPIPVLPLALGVPRHLHRRRDGNADPATGWSGGFSCVIGNPPWERVKIQDKEFFGNLGRTDIESAATAAIRKRMIDELADTDPALLSRHTATRYDSPRRTAHLLLKSGRYPLTGQGDVNTYSVFAETMRTVVGPTVPPASSPPPGWLPTRHRALLLRHAQHQRLYAFYDFENEAKIFRDVHHAVRFAMTVMTGAARKVERSRFAFLTRHIADVPLRRFELAPTKY